MGIESNATNLKMKTCGLVHCVALFCACHELMSRLISKSNTRVSVAKMVTWSASRSSSMWWDDTLAFTHFYKKRRATMQWWWYEVWTLDKEKVQSYCPKKVNGQACPMWRLSEIENIIGSTDNHFSMGHYLSCFSAAIEHVRRYVKNKAEV